MVGLVPGERAERQDGEAAGCFRRGPHCPQEPVAAPRHGLDPGLPVGLVAQGLAQDRDVDAEVGLLDERVGPHATEELLLRDDLARVADEDGEQVDRLRGHLEELVAPEDEPPRDVEAEGAELEDGGSPAHSSDCISHGLNGFDAPANALELPRASPVTSSRPLPTLQGDRRRRP